MNKYNIETIKLEFEERGYQLLDDNYKSAHTKMEYICHRHQNIGVQSITYVYFRRGVGCKSCAIESGKSHVKLHISHVKERFEECGYTLVSKEYINRVSQLEYICNKHIDKGVQKITYNSFASGTRCKFCHLDKIRHSYDFILGEFIKRDYILLETKYLNSNTKMEYICNKHPESTQKITYSALYSGQGCKFCGIEKQSGENSYLWKGGTTPLHNHLRKKLINWKKDSLKENGYSCLITGKRFDSIHHLYSFNKILEESMNELSLPIYTVISDYTEEELHSIEQKCLEIHYRYPLGVPLCDVVHKEFHKIYGYDNTPEQFEEFKQTKLNEYNKVGVVT